MQVKIFYDGGHIPSDRFESVISSLSRKINEWLQENPDIEIVNILQSESQGTENAWNLTLTVFYRL
jgi:serine protease inhibitor